MRKQIEDAVGAVYAATVTNPIEQLSLMQKLTNRLFSVAILYIGIIIIGATVFSYSENKGLMDSIWWAVVTSTSVGYGDIYPMTFIGRIDGMAIMILSLFMVIPVLTAQFAAQLIVNSDAFTHDEQEEMKANLRAAIIMLREVLDRLDSLENKS